MAMFKTKTRMVKIAALSTVLGLCAAAVLAASTSTFNQTINAGALSVDIKDASKVTVASPAVAMSAKSVSLDCQNGGSSSSGTFGTNSERIYVTNAGAADNGWTLDIAATDGTTAYWKNVGDTLKFDFNDANTGGCGDGADADSLAGQMTIDASVGTVTADCVNCTNGNIAKGASASFAEASVDSINLLTAALASDNIGRWYLTGISVKQTIPAEQAAAAYSVNLTLTTTAS